MITYADPIYLNESIVFNWTSDISSPTYAIYLNGLFERTQTDTSFTLTDLKPNDIYRFEVFDTSSFNVENYYPNFYNLNFYSNNTNITRYLIEELNDSSSYFTTANIVRRSGQFYYNYDTPQYEDGETVTVRITPYYSNNTPGTPFIFTDTVISYPTQVNSRLTIDEDGSLILSKYNINEVTVTTAISNPYDR